MPDLSDTYPPTPLSDALLQVASRIVTQLRSSPDWEEFIYSALAELGSAAGASRCLLIESLPTGDHEVVMRLASEWESPVAGSSASPPIRFTVPSSMFSDRLWREQLPAGALLTELERMPASFRMFLESSGIRSLIVEPIDVNARLWGCLVLADSLNDRAWSAIERSAMQLVGSAISGAIERQRNEFERLRNAAIFESSEDAIISKSIDGIVTDWNGAAERIYGYTRDEMIGESITRIVPESHQDELQEIMQALKAGERVEHHETIRVHKDGRKLAISLSISPIINYLGSITGAVTIARDVSERKRSELELSASEERLRLALDAGNIGAWDWDVASNVVVWSPNMERLHGLEPGTFGGTFDEYQKSIHPDDSEQLIRALYATLAGEQPFQLEYRGQRADGSYQWLSTLGSAVRDATGNAVRMTGVCYDVTAQKQVQSTQVALLAKLQHARSEADAESARLRELFQHAPSLMALLEGPDHVFSLANDPYLHSIGYRDILNRPIAEALPEMVDQGLVELLDQVYRTGVTVTRSELPILVEFGPNGALDKRYFSFAYQPNRNLQGEVIGILVHAVDLTDHVRARQRVELLARETAGERDRLQQIIDVLPEGVTIADSDGRFVLVNSAALAIWGQPTPAGGYERYSVFECYAMDGTLYTVEELPLTRTVKTGEVVLGEQMSIRNVETGQLIPVLINCAPLWGQDGSISGAVAVFQDISPLKDFEQQKDEFLQAVSHDLKNPLTAIIGNIQLLDRMSSMDPARIEATIRNMESAAGRAIAMLDEVLDLTRQQMGRPLELTIEQVDLVAMAHRLAEQHQSIASHHQIVVNSNVDELSGQWDSVRLERVIANLLGNAIQYSPAGGEIGLEVHREDFGQDAVALVRIRDNGLGIPSHEIPRLFERFWRGSNVRDQVRGTGLGLAGAKAIIDAHEGEIFVESVEGTGSTFTVRLPLSPSHPVTEG